MRSYRRKRRGIPNQAANLKKLWEEGYTIGPNLNDAMSWLGLSATVRLGWIEAFHPQSRVKCRDLPPREGRCVSAPVQLVNTGGGGSAEPVCACL